LMTAEDPPEKQLPFATARDNFYATAQHGLDAHIDWFGEKRCGVRGLILDELLPMARRGLEALEIDKIDIDRYLGIIRMRVETVRNGAAWQRAYVARHGRDFAAMTNAYRQRQESGMPVHEWDLS
jgi:hypothetical protein